MTSSLQTFSRCFFFFNGGELKHLGGILPDWVNEDIEKSLAEALDKFQKQEEEKKPRFFLENDLNASNLS